MKWIDKFILFGIITIASFSRNNLNAQTQSTFKGWVAAFGTYKLNPKWAIYFDGQIRSTDQWKGMQTYIVRPGIHYYFAKNMIATLGYAYVGNYRVVSGVTGWLPEHRIWEQYILNQSFKLAERATSLQHRFRLEQRFISKPLIDGNKLKTDGFQFAQRLRYFARSIFPFVPAATFNKGTFLALQDEIFVNVTNAAVTNDKFFDQNRAYVAFGYRTSPKYDFEIGYMNQFVSERIGNTSNNILQFAFYFRL